MNCVMRAEDCPAGMLAVVPFAGPCEFDCVPDPRNTTAAWRARKEAWGPYSCPGIIPPLSGLGQTSPVEAAVPWTAWAVVIGLAAGMFALSVSMSPGRKRFRRNHDDLTGVFPYVPPGNDNVGLSQEQMMADDEEYDEDWQPVPPKSKRRPTPPFRVLDDDLNRNGRRRRFGRR